MSCGLFPITVRFRYVPSSLLVRTWPYTSSTVSFMESFPLKQSSKGIDAGSANAEPAKRREKRARRIGAGRRPKRLLIVGSDDGGVEERGGGQINEATSHETKSDGSGILKVFSFQLHNDIYGSTKCWLGIGCYLKFKLEFWRGSNFNFPNFTHRGISATRNVHVFQSERTEDFGGASKKKTPSYNRAGLTVSPSSLFIFLTIVARRIREGRR